MKKVLLRTNNLSELRAIQALTSLPDKSSKTGPAVICPEGLSGKELFRWAMEGVEPISRGDIPEKRARIVFRPKEDPFEEIFQARQWPLVWYLQSEHIEGADPSVSRVTLKKLRRGHFSVRAECDLHGLPQKEARHAVISFIEESARRGLGCVRIIHGKGNNSHDKIPVLKARLQEWLFHRRLSRHVLAYSSARPCDGGTGAIYVLLRRK
jgi:DNA-nicking Smr family endonuclease